MLHSRKIKVSLNLLKSSQVSGSVEPDYLIYYLYIKVESRYSSAVSTFL